MCVNSHSLWVVGGGEGERLQGVCVCALCARVCLKTHFKSILILTQYLSSGALYAANDRPSPLSKLSLVL